jgi:hypothetical protein
MYEMFSGTSVDAMKVFFLGGRGRRGDFSEN